MVIGKCAEMFAKEPDSRDAQEAAECRIGVPDRPVLDYQDTDRRILGKWRYFIILSLNAFSASLRALILTAVQLIVLSSIRLTTGSPSRLYQSLF